MVMPAERLGTRRWTAREVRQLIADQPLYTPRYELVDGELLVTPSPRLEHQRAVYLLVMALGNYLERELAGVLLMSPSDVELEPEDVRQPDVFVMPIEEWQRTRHAGFPVRELMLAIEVLSPSSSRYDRVTKRPGYQRHVAEYWIVDVDARLVERWRAGDERPEIVTDQLTWTPAGASQPFMLDLPAYFAKILD
jgi:Uma2 family endonuclease